LAICQSGGEGRKFICESPAVVTSVKLEYFSWEMALGIFQRPIHGSQNKELEDLPFGNCRPDGRWSGRWSLETDTFSANGDYPIITIIGKGLYGSVSHIRTDI